MGLNKEVLIYKSVPFSKFRWISYMSAAQVGFIGLNLFVMPTSRLIQERKNIIERNDSDKSEFAPDDEPSEPPSLIGPSFLSKLVSFNYGKIFSLRNLRDNFNEKPYLCSGMVVASGMISTAMIMYAKRSAHMITLLPNDRVRFSSFSPLGTGAAPTIEVPLTDVSCVASRTSQNNFSILKFKGYMGFHLVSKTEGEFLEPQLYDRYLGYTRSWSK